MKKDWGPEFFYLALTLAFTLATWSAYSTREKREADRLLEKQNETDKNMSHVELFMKSTRKAFNPSP